MIAGERTIERLSLPAEGIMPGRENGARIQAFAVRSKNGEVVGLMVARRRRSAVSMRVTQFKADEPSGALLARTLIETAEAKGIREIRAADDLPAAAAAFGMSPTGRGYFQKWIGEEITTASDVGRFNQTTGFTCGPVALAMALGPTVSRANEVAIWREATTVIGLSGPGGCDPYGLALAAQRRAGAVQMFIDTDAPVFLDRANTEEKRDLMRFVQAQFKEEATKHVHIVERRFTVDDLEEAIAGGKRVLLLVDQAHTHNHPAPHWVLVHAAAGDVFLVNDPWIQADDGETAADTDCVPITRAMLDRMGRYGEPAYSAAIVLEPLKHPR